MTVSRRLFLRHAAAVSAVAATVSTPAAAAEPEMTPHEQAIWHLRQLERLVIEDGGTRPTIIAVADYGDDSGYRGCRGIRIYEGRVRNDDGMFAPKGGDA